MNNNIFESWSKWLNLCSGGYIAQAQQKQLKQQLSEFDKLVDKLEQPMSVTELPQAIAQLTSSWRSIKHSLAQKVEK